MKRFHYAMLFAAILAMAGPLSLGGEFWVNNLRGDDEQAGTREAPFQSIDRALKALKPGDTLHVMPTEEAYPSDIRIEHVSGTPEARIVIDGHGSVVSGWKQLPNEAWKAEGGGIFSRPLRNNAWGMETHWEGGFALVHFEGEAGRNVISREALVPYSYLLYKNRKEAKEDPLHNTLFICLPEGKTPDDVRVEAIDGRGGIYVAGSHITVRNFITEYGGTDGYATHRNKDVVFENIEARYFMDQGMSHHGAEVIVRNAWFHNNAGCGIVDVYPEVVVRYENCLIEYDTWRGGVELYSGRFEMENCIIRGNPKKALTVTRGAQVKLKNCLLTGPFVGGATGIYLSDLNSSLEMENCTLKGFAVGLQAAMTATSRLTMRNCAWVDCDVNTRIIALQTVGQDPVDVTTNVSASGNAYEASKWEYLTRVQKEEGGWASRDYLYQSDEHARFAEAIGADADATILPAAAGSAAEFALPERAGARPPRLFQVGPESSPHMYTP